MTQARPPDEEQFTYDPIIFKATDKLKIKLSQLKYFTFTLIGVALLWPWNCFLSASAYYAERFAHSPSLVKMLSSTIMTVSSIISTLFNFYLSQSQQGVNYNLRLNSGLILTIIVFLIMAISCVSDFFIKMKDQVFFVTLITLVLISAIATCFAQNGTMAIVNVMGPIYANGVMVGQAIAGVLPSVALIVSILLIGDKPKAIIDDYEYVDKNFGVFVYYITATLISIVCMALLYLTNHYRTESAYSTLNQMVDLPLDAEEPPEETPELTQTKFVSFWVLWSKLKLIVLTIFLTFSITLIFPVFASNVKLTNAASSEHVFFQDKIFIPFIFLMWNLGDLLARVICGWKNSILLIKNPKVLFIYSLSRLIFIPLFLTCNIHPYTSADESSALVNSDLWYIFLQLLFGLSNGQLSTSCFMIVGSFCDDDDEKEAAGGFTTVFLSTGLAFGSILSYLLVLLID